MSRRLLLCRHGNTFSSDQTVVMVGAREDLPLTPAGRVQASSVGAALNRNTVSLEQIVTGPLVRTSEFARIVSETVNGIVPVRVDSRLTELDYGEWGGLSDDEIRQRWGSAALEAWQTEGRRPEEVTFRPSEKELEAEVVQFLADVASLAGTILVVTSNGRLREIARLLGGRPDKVKTGHMCVLEMDTTDSWRITHWNCKPEELSL